VSKKDNAMNKKILTTVLVCFGAAMFGCATEEAPPPGVGGPTFEEITRNPRLVSRVNGCWFDNETLVYTSDGVENMCAVRARGEEISCSELCEASAFTVYDLCGSVSQCTALLWVGSENPLEDERGCWRCVEGCFGFINRSPDEFFSCRPTGGTPQGEQVEMVMD
jgi:hypothetical protein